MKLLIFGQGNSKLDRFTDTFSLPASWSCKSAKYCRSAVDRKTGKLKDGPHCKFRCAAAYTETLYPNVRKARWHNFDLLRQCKSVKQMADLIDKSLPPNPIKVRPGVSGDYFSQMYFDAWLEVAKRHPNTLFYSYTKEIPFWLARKKYIPDNFVLTASYGGKYDSLIKPNKLKSVTVVYSPEEATKLGLKLDHDDSSAYKGTKNFAVLLHGMQPKDTEAGEAYTLLRRRGIAGYGTNKANRAKL